MQHACSSCSTAIPRSARHWSACLRSWITTCPHCGIATVARSARKNRAALRVAFDFSSITGRIGFALLLFFGSSVSLVICTHAWLTHEMLNFWLYTAWLLFKTPYLLFCILGGLGVCIASPHLSYRQRVFRWSIVAVPLASFFLLWHMATSMGMNFSSHMIDAAMFGLALTLLAVVLGSALMLDRFVNRAARRKNRARVRALFGRE